MEDKELFLKPDVMQNVSVKPVAAKKRKIATVAVEEIKPEIRVGKVVYVGAFATGFECDGVPYQIPAGYNYKIGDDIHFTIDGGVKVVD